MKREMVKTIIPVMMLPLLLAATVSRAQAPEIEMVFVKGGTFMMGCTADQGKDCNSSERPVHQVTLSDYYIGKYEVTQAQWEAVMGENPSHFTALIWEDMEAFLRRLNERNRTSYAIPSKSQWEKAALPVESVSWKAAQEFIRRLNILTGKKYRLPTEAEWEYAARGGAESRHYQFSGSNNPNEVSWYGNNSEGQTHPVGTKKANELGIYDMTGNVWEWCSDWFTPYDYAAQTNPQGAASGTIRTFRGGSWNSIAQRISIREDDLPDNTRNNLGLRLAISSQ